MSKGLKVTLIVLTALLVILGCCAIALAIDDSNRLKQVPENTILDGEVDISGMTKEQLTEVINKRVADGKVASLSLAVGTEVETAPLTDIGQANVDKTIQAAYSSRDSAFYNRWLSRIKSIFGEKSEQHTVSTVYDVNDEAVNSYSGTIAKKYNVKPVNATYKYSDGKLTPVAGKDGVSVNVDETSKAIIEAVAKDNTGKPFAQAVCEVKKPDRETATEAILVNTSACTVTVYKGEQATFSCSCTPGTSGHETPKGNFYLSGKQYMPTWYNPHSAWSANMPETIAPGASNPLGLRALEVSCGGGIYIHGTTNSGQLGSTGSHGCVRVSNDNICKLYDMVSVGCPIIII